MILSFSSKVRQRDENDEETRGMFAGKPLVFVEESKEDHRLFECRVYSSTPILVRRLLYTSETDMCDKTSVSLFL